MKLDNAVILCVGCLCGALTGKNWVVWRFIPRTEVSFFRSFKHVLMLIRVSV